MAGLSLSPDLVLATGEDESDIKAQIDSLEEFFDAMMLGKKFQPEVSMKGILEIEIAQQRLRLALKKATGHMKNHNVMGDALTGMRHGDHGSRTKLRKLIAELQGQLDQVDEDLKKQFNFEEATRCAIPESEKYEKFLEEEKSIIVVAGEVSSGKSTLLNLILSEEILPAKRLSCTFTACELVYGPTKKACILLGDGQSSEDIDFEEREKYIYKQTSRDTLFKHRGVRLFLPFSMLQSGITLVDTPGVGEHSKTAEIVLDYVRENEVFGFIFTINAFDSGGVRSQFKELLHKLSKIEDTNKHRKLNPSSVIFVVNFWDKVPDKDKKDTQEQIEYYLKKMPFMGTFNPEEQIFYMDSHGAMESLNLEAKLITDDFEQLVDGIRKYFPVGQKLKLEESYLWMQNLFERLIHPMKTFLVKQRPGDRSKEISQKIEEVQRQFKGIISDAQNKYKTSLSELSNKLFKSLPEQRNKVMAWKTEDIPTQLPAESWTMYEERLDNAIDDRISQIIVDVEEEHEFISKAYVTLAHKVAELINNILNQLSDIERALRNNVIRGMRQRINIIERRNQHSNIDVSFGRVHGAELIVPKFAAQTMFERMLYGPAVAIFGPTQQQRRQAIKQEMEKFHSNPSHFMSIRAGVIYKHYCTKENINQIAEQELTKIEDYIRKNADLIPEQIQGNRALLEHHANIATRAKPNDSKHRTFLEEIQKLYDELLLLGRESIVIDTFKQADICYANKRPSFIPDESLPQHFHEAKLKQPKKESEMVTLMEFNATPCCVLRYRETDRYNHQENLRMCVAGKLAPKFLGTYNNGQTLVLLGHLFPARVQAKRKIIDLKTRWQNQIDSFMTLLGDLGRALNMIHLKKMAHCILSLDTLLLDKKEDFSVRLTNLFELATVQINENENLQTGQLMYLAPEILFGDQKLYTTAADVYALGLIMIELWYRYDVFYDLKKLHLNQFKEQYKGDTGQLLLIEAERVMKEVKNNNENTIVIRMPEKYQNLVCECLRADDKRIDMGMWTEMWDASRVVIKDEAKQGISLI